jgi:heptosyltransferase-2
MKSNKILIIKTGYSEILDRETCIRKVSLGDVLRTTPILHLYKGQNVTWLTDLEAFPLLERNPYITRLMAYDFTTRDQLLAEIFDSMINLEKYPPICGLASQINAWKKYGFRLDAHTGKSQAYDRASEVLTVSADPNAKKDNKRTIQELLFEMVGEKWKGEEYILGYKPKKPNQRNKYDVLLNTKIGQKWPAKSWSMQNWDKLETILTTHGFRVTRQDKQSEEVLTNLNTYMNWLDSSKMIVSNDSLGMHLGIALHKKVLGLFGPTPNSEVYFYNRGEAIIPEPIPSCMPCFEGNICKRGKNCMQDISPEKVYQEILKYSL